MEQICPKELCTACSACINVCPKDAIHMVEEGDLGYFYPVIDPKRCIDCKLCEKTCPANRPTSLRTPLKAFAATSKDLDDLMSSTSGAASSLLAQEILHRGGIVYGCGQDTYRDIHHVRIDRTEDAWRIKGSKYVQSRLDLTFRSVKKDLQEGREVMFSGTPCQIAGLRNFLRKDYENLLLVDLVCHGVPSQKLLRENVDSLLDRHGVTDRKLCVSFRRKGRRTSDLRYGVYLAREVDAVPIDLGHDGERPYNDYIMAFLGGITFRDNCFSCPYARPQRGGDITIADFWGLQECSVSPARGVSLLLANTEKGEQMVATINDKAVMEERPVTEAIRGNGQLNKPSRKPTERARFVELHQLDVKLAYKECLKRTRRRYRKDILQMKIVAAIKGIPWLGTLLHKNWKRIKQNRQ